MTRVLLLWLLIATLAGLSCSERKKPKIDSLKPRESKEDLEAIVKQLGGRLFPEEPQGTYFVNLTDVTIESGQLKRLSSFQSIVELSLLNSTVDDEGLVFVAKCKGLRRINLSNTQVTNKGVASLGVLSLLTDIDLSRTRIHGKDFECIDNLYSLKVLVLDKSQTTLNALRVFDRHGTLEDIYIDDEGKKDEGGKYNVWMRGLGTKGSERYWRKD